MNKRFLIGVVMAARQCVILLAVVLSLGAYRSSGQVLQDLGASPYNGNDNAQGYFASQADSFHESDPLALPPWGSAGSGPYGGYGVPTVSVPPVTGLYTSQLLPAERYYGSPYAFSFTDGGSPPTTATATIATGPLGGGSVASAYVKLTNIALSEPLPPSQYAYEQIDLVTDFGVAGPLTGGIGGAPSFSVTATTTGAGSYAQFAGEVTYLWTPSNTAFSGSLTGVWTSLGTVDYSWSTTGPGTFTATVAPGGALSATPSGPGVLELSGDFFVAGDPAHINVEETPEPAVVVQLLALAMGGGVAWVWRRWRYRRVDIS